MPAGRKLRCSLRIADHSCPASSLRRENYASTPGASTAIGLIHSTLGHVQHGRVVAMFPWHMGRSDREASFSQAVPILCLLGVVALLSTITPAMKYVLEHSGLTFLSIANGRIVIGFLFLTVMTACWDWKGVRALTHSDGARFGALGLLIYSLLPTFTAFFSWCLSKEQVSWSGFSGILLSWAGCLAALATNLEGGAIEVSFGDPLVFLFTLMMAAHIVMSMHIVRRHGVLTANTAMFGTSAVLVSGCSMAWSEPAPAADL